MSRQADSNERERSNKALKTRNAESASFFAKKNEGRSLPGAREESVHKGRAARILGEGMRAEDDGRAREAIGLGVWVSAQPTDCCPVRGTAGPGGNRIGPYYGGTRRKPLAYLHTVGRSVTGAERLNTFLLPT